MKNQDTKVQVLTSVKWVSLGQVLPKLFSPITTIILAGLLNPKDYGIIAICGVLISFFSLIQGLGFIDFIIKDQTLTPKKLSTIFWSNLSMSIILYMIVLLLTPVFARFYKEPLLARVLPIISLTIIFDAIGTVSLALLNKHLEFKKLFYLTFLPLLLTIAVIIPLAYYGFGVWSLVIGTLSRSIFTNVYYIIMSKWKLSFAWNRKYFSSIIRFGSWVMAEKLQESMYANWDLLVIGYFQNLSVTGIYILAKSWVQLCFNLINSPLTGVIYPILSKFQNNLEKLRSIYFDVEKRMFFLNISVAVGIFFLSPVIIPLFFSNKWHGLETYLAILVIGEGIARNLSIQRDIFKLINRPEIYPRIFFISFILALILYPIGAYFSMFFFCLIKIFNDIIYTILQMKITSIILKFKIISYWTCAKSTIICSLTMGFVLFLLIHLISHTFLIRSNIFVGGLLIFAGFATFIMTYWLLEKKSLYAILNEAKVIIGLNPNKTINN